MSSFQFVVKLYLQRCCYALWTQVVVQWWQSHGLVRLLSNILTLTLTFLMVFKVVVQLSVNRVDIAVYWAVICPYRPVCRCALWSVESDDAFSNFPVPFSAID
jgi:hypothetical protein